MLTALSAVIATLGLLSVTPSNHFPSLIRAVISPATILRPTVRIFITVVTRIFSLLSPSASNTAVTLPTFKTVDNSGAHFSSTVKSVPFLLLLFIIPKDGDDKFVNIS